MKPQSRQSKRNTCFRIGTKYACIFAELQAIIFVRFFTDNVRTKFINPMVYIINTYIPFVGPGFNCDIHVSMVLVKHDTIL